MTGSQYADLIARYVLHNYGARGITVYREVSLGKTIIGKDRRIDVLLIHEATARGFAVECKYQDSQGTVDEKIPYALQDMEALRTPGCVTYAGEGFSKGILHVLAASHLAAYCLPDERNVEPSSMTWELDHMLAMNFGWWDVVEGGIDSGDDDRRVYHQDTGASRSVDTGDFSRLGRPRAELPW